jgi:hypothetical protein
VSAQLSSSLPFSLPGGFSPSADVAILPRHITLPSHGAETSSLPPLHHPATLHPIASPLELKPKHWICTITIGHPLYTARLPPSTTIKRLSQPWPLSIARAPRHRSSTRCRHSLSSLSHAHHPSTQWHSWWGTRWSSFALWTTYPYVNLRKNIFWHPAISREVIN